MAFQFFVNHLVGLSNLCPLSGAKVDFFPRSIKIHVGYLYITLCTVLKLVQNAFIINHFVTTNLAGIY